MKMNKSIQFSSFLMDKESKTMTARYLFQKGLQDLLTVMCGTLMADVVRHPARAGITGRFIQAFSRPTLGGLREFALWLSQENAGRPTQRLMEYIKEDNKNGWITTMVQLRNKWAHPKDASPETLLKQAEHMLAKSPDFTPLGCFHISEKEVLFGTSENCQINVSPFLWVQQESLKYFSHLKNDQTLACQDKTAPTQPEFNKLWQKIRHDDPALANATIEEIHYRISRRKSDYQNAQAPWWLKKVLKKGAIGLITDSKALDGIGAHLRHYWPEASLLDLTLEPDVPPSTIMATVLGLFHPPDIADLVSWVDSDHRTAVILRAQTITTRDMGHILFWLADLYDAGLNNQMRIFIGRSQEMLEQDFIYLEERMPDDMDKLLRYPPGIEPRTLKECLWAFDQKKYYWPI